MISHNGVRVNACHLRSTRLRYHESEPLDRLAAIGGVGVGWVGRWGGVGRWGVGGGVLDTRSFSHCC